jgi:TRAP-type C4-dicarboxylate transport system permease small subunit
MSVIKCIGKRRLSIVSMAGTAICCLSLGIYAATVLPSGWTSFDKHELLESPTGINYVPMFLFFGLAFFTSVGIAPVPWMLLSEIFPFK